MTSIKAEYHYIEKLKIQFQMNKLEVLLKEQIIKKQLLFLKPQGINDERPDYFMKYNLIELNQLLNLLFT